MITTSELKKEQVDDLDMTISITLRVGQWRHIAGELNLSLKDNWTGTKADFIAGIRDSIEGMTAKMDNKYPVIPIPKKS